MTNDEMTVLFSDAQRHEIKAIVNEALVEFFRELGITSKGYIVTAAMIVGSITVLVGGFKALLAAIGFTYMK